MYFDLASIPAKDHVAHTRLYLEDAAAIMCMLLCILCLPLIALTGGLLLRTRFGCIDPDAETNLWDQLHDLKQGTMTVA